MHINIHIPTCTIENMGENPDDAQNQAIAARYDTLCDASIAEDVMGAYPSASFYIRRVKNLPHTHVAVIPGDDERFWKTQWTAIERDIRLIASTFRADLFQQATDEVVAATTT